MHTLTNLFRLCICFERIKRPKIGEGSDEGVGQGANWSPAKSISKYVVPLLGYHISPPSPSIKTIIKKFKHLN